MAGSIAPTLYIIGTGSPTTARERVLYSEPPAELEDFPEKRQVGVVKPYAVVELNETWVAANEEQLRKKSSQTLYTSDFYDFSPPPIPRPRVASLTTLAIRSTVSPTPYKSSTSPRSMSSSKRGKIVPKRKAPPPPNRGMGKYDRTKRSSSVPPQSFTDSVDDLLQTAEITRTKCKAKTVALNKPSVLELRPKEKSPPRKPPRTQSTFFNELPPSSSQMSLIYPFEATEKKQKESPIRQRRGGVNPPASDYEPLRKPGISASSLSLITFSPTVAEQLQEMFDEALSTVSSRCIQKMSSSEEMCGVEWSDITVRTDEKGRHQFFYHMHQINIEVRKVDSIIININ